ncbi:VWA domain-containing protein [Actinomycetospora sp. TBRC 11914]|uniref:VWA domain-containing protein n=1 Tax=Actinomycetospora sp. TBRC 11914 TaxID=2729387 RepID=UPI00145ECC99|nr:VWA domain-containing protein [Actinomycetospora sp. TBRC 11914]NMO91416.1 VWA domain-containing protein [Actinomycetospora sp. TBRC 11914]
MSTPTRGLPAHLVDFVQALRAHHVDVGPGETVDAAAVVAELDLLRRDQLREGLAAALLRRSGQRATFDALFDLWWPLGQGAALGEVALPYTDDGSVDVDALRDLLAQLLADGDTAALSELARAVVDGLGALGVGNGRGAGSGGSGSGQDGGGGSPSGFSSYQALNSVRPETLLARVLSDLRGRREGDAESPFAEEVARRETRARIAEFRRMVQAETARRGSEIRGREAAARTGVRRQAEQTDFLSAGADTLADLRRRVAPLGRHLATRLAARRRRAHRGPIDMRRTLRRSMSTGGVPVELVHRRPRPGRPELVLLCDVSGSVAGFSHFTMMLVQALREQFSRIRIFCFVDGCVEVTDLFTPGADLAQVMTEVHSRPGLVAWSGHSDYGRAFERFAERWPDAVTERSSLLVLGDARTNHQDPALGVLSGIVGRARHAHWLNPEPQRQWGTGDSAAREYGRVMPMHECRTAAQLAGVVGGLLPV